MISSHFDLYLSSFHNEKERQTIIDTSHKILANVNQLVQTKNTIDGLLFGNVQSGKTRQILGAMTLLADNQFPIFMLITTDNIKLQEQTLKRVRETLTDFCVIGEYDDTEFFNCKLQRPIVLVLKKNTNVLKKWRGNINTSGYCSAKPLVVFDDEADAASLNTKVNKGTISTINKHLQSIKSMASCCVYIQVTATPQAVILQTVFSTWKPEFVVYFEPGDNYLGGDFFFTDPPAFCVRFTNENELDDVRDGSSFIPEGLRKSLLTFLVVCAHKSSKNDETCNFLIHPGVKNEDHDIFANRISEHLNLLINSFDEKAISDELKSIWNDLKSTQPDIINYDDMVEILRTLLDEQRIRPVVINSKSPYDASFENGYNIVVGGNCLGRGLTLKNLQVVYYCRKAKVPQADTSWQHSRMFGYDRERGLMRVFMPPSLYTLFCSLNSSNNVLFKQISEHGIDGIQLILPGKIRPTRSCVLNKAFLNIITGGVNFFPNFPVEDNTNELDDALKGFDHTHLIYDVNSETILSLLLKLLPPPEDDWDLTKYINCVRALSTQRPHIHCKLIVRRERDIARGTGTLLSQNDRDLGDKFTDAIVLTLYRIVGTNSKGWKGLPFWIPNIKFPSDTCYYDTRE